MAFRFLHLVEFGLIRWPRGLCYRGNGKDGSNECSFNIYKQ